MQYDLHYHSYKFQLTIQINARNQISWLNVTNGKNAELFQNLFMSDKAHFKLIKYAITINTAVLVEKYRKRILL